MPAEPIRCVKGEGLSVTELELARGNVTMHLHRCSRIYLPLDRSVVENGRAWSEERVEMRPPGHRHELVVTAPSRLLMIVLEPWRHEQVAPFFRQPEQPRSIASSLLRGTIRALREAMGRADGAATILVPALALQVIAQAAIIESGADERTALAARALSYLREHVSEPLTKAEIARGLRTSPRSLARAFRTSTGETLMAALLRMRTELALQLIATTGDSLKEIAGRCGFYDQSHMTRQVKRATGRTPLAIRRSLSAPSFRR